MTNKEPLDNDEEDEEDVPDEKDLILERIWRMKREGAVFRSTEDGTPEQDPRPSSGYTMFPSRQRFGR